MKHYILDANNILHKHHEWKRTVVASPEEATGRLLIALYAYASRYSSYKFTVVLDATETSLLSVARNVILLPKGKHPNADSVIKELLRNERSLTSCVVVSSDNEVYAYARIHAAMPLRSEEFIAFLQQTPPIPKSRESARKKEKPLGVSKRHVHEFSDLFNKDLDDDWMDTMK